MNYFIFCNFFRYRLENTYIDTDTKEVKSTDTDTWKSFWTDTDIYRYRYQEFQPILNDTDTDTWAHL